MKTRIKPLIKRLLGRGLSRLRPDIVRKIETDLETVRAPGGSDGGHSAAGPDAYSAASAPRLAPASR